MIQIGWEKELKNQEIHSQSGLKQTLNPFSNYCNFLTGQYWKELLTSEDRAGVY